MSEENNSGSSYLIYILLFVLFILVPIGIYLFYYHFKKDKKTSTTSNTTNITNTETLTNNDKLKIAKYKNDIISLINKRSGIVVKESFVDFNNVIGSTVNDKGETVFITPEKRTSSFEGLESGNVNDTRSIKCSKVIGVPDDQITGVFNVKCNNDNKWQTYDFNCDFKGIDKKVDINGAWYAIRLTDDEIKGKVPIDFNRELSEEDKKDPNNLLIVKNFDMETEKGIIYVDRRDTGINYIKTVGYTVPPVFPIGMKFLDNGKFNILLSRGFFLKKKED